jgi:iron uptake system EfeUOB component EfeO/EfeM
VKGFVPESQAADVKQLASLLKESKLHDGKIYGVRKADIEFIKSQKNWINLDTLVTGKLSKLDNTMIMSLVKYSIDFNNTMQYNIVSLIDANSPYATLYNTFSKINRADSQQLSALGSLCEIYKIPMTSELDKLVAKHTKEINAVKARYPLLDYLHGYGVKAAPVAEYVNCIDKMHNDKKVP